MVNDTAPLSEQMLRYYSKAGAYVRHLYAEGLKHAPWSIERANFHHRSLIFFVKEFIQPPLPIPPFHMQWYWWMVSEPSYINLTAREHGKTETHSMFRPTWELCCDPALRFVLPAKKQAIAEQSLAAVKNYLALPRIVAGFGQLNPAKLPPERRLTEELDWGKDTITLNRDERSRPIRGPSVLALGALSSVLSIRAERLIADDIFDKLIAESPRQCERVIDWYDDDLLPILVPQREGGQEILVGTQYNNRDIYAHKQRLVAEQEQPLYKIFKGDAILDEVEETTLWEDKWPYSELMVLRAKLGSIRFNRNFRSTIMSDEDSSFPMIWFKGGIDDEGNHYRGCYDAGLKLRTGLRDSRGRYRYHSIVIGIDPAMGKSLRSKFFAAVVLGLNQFGDIQLLDARRAKLGFIKQRDLVIELWQRWGGLYIKAVVVETNAYQNALNEGLKEKEARIPIVVKTTTGKDPIHIPTMDVYFETGRVRLPTGDGPSLQLSEQLAEELNLWPNAATSDLLMAYFFAHMRLLRYAPLLASVPIPDNLAFGDTQRGLSQRQMTAGGVLLPKRTVRRIREMVSGAPISPIRQGPLHSLRPGILPVERPESVIPKEW